MIVYGYHAPVPGLPDQGKLIDLWSKTWAQQGFTPIILSEGDAQKNPLYPAFKAHILDLPTTNPKTYEMACYLRHLAMQVIGGGLLTDMDVMPRKVETVRALKPDLNLPTILEPTRVPCAVFGSADAYGVIALQIMQVLPVAETKHISDMTILRSTLTPTRDICLEFGCTGSNKPDDFGHGWEKADLIHFSTHSMRRAGFSGNKAEIIPHILRDLGR